MKEEKNILGTESVGSLLQRFAAPSVIAMLVGALYNIIDQIFIGHSVGMYGNAATNVALPCMTICIAWALLCGVGGASGFNLHLGAGRQREAGEYLGTSLLLLAGGGLLLSLLTLTFLPELMLACGATPEVLPYALEFTGVICLGFPFYTFSAGVSHLIRADGSPRFAMGLVLAGALLNCILNPIFIFVCGWGIAGSAWATVVGQLVSTLAALWYLLRRFASVRLTASCFAFSPARSLHVAMLGSANCINQLGMMVVQVALNNTLKYYGAQSPYGSDIPLAAVGIITKVNMIFFAFIIGISQGMQPIASYNYGSGDYRRVAAVLRLALRTGAVLSLAAFACFQLWAREITAVFGSGSELYFHFAEEYFHIFLFGTLYNFSQPITSNFFTAIGKSYHGVFLSLSRQVLYLLPLILLLPRFLGIDGVMYAGLLADSCSALTAFVMGRRELARLNAA